VDDPDRARPVCPGRNGSANCAAQHLVGISPKTLTDRLRTLEDQGLVERRIYAEVPSRVEYSLTDAGQSLQPVLFALADWGRSTTPIT
jgi:DNA-binding HxlR family transcriptional regulator